MQILYFKYGQEKKCLLPGNAGVPQLFLVFASDCSSLLGNREAKTGRRVQGFLWLPDFPSSVESLLNE